jgi:ABC-type phosphate transport system substrate-binding protein
MQVRTGRRALVTMSLVATALAAAVALTGGARDLAAASASGRAAHPTVVAAPDPPIIRGSLAVDPMGYGINDHDEWPDPGPKLAVR